MLGQGVGEGREHDVDALVGFLDHLIAGQVDPVRRSGNEDRLGIDEVGIVTPPA